MRLKNIIKSWLDDKPVYIRHMGSFSEAKFDCIYVEKDMIVGLFYYPGLHSVSCCGLIFKFETSIFRRNSVRVVLVELPKNPGTAITLMCERIAQYVHNNLLAHYPIGHIMWYEHYVITEKVYLPIVMDKIFFEVNNIEGSLYYQNPTWKKDEDREFLDEIIATVSKVFNIKYRDPRKDVPLKDLYG
jgi:hypothetical protein